MIDYPDDVMETFRAMTQMLALTTADGCIEAAIPDPTQPDGVRWRLVPDDHLDELVARGWVELTDTNRVKSTDTGRYHLRRWIERREKAERKARRAG